MDSLGFRAVLIMLFAALSSGVGAQSLSAPSGDSPVSIPLSVSQLPAFGTYKANISIGIGNLPALPIGFDTGSSGLHVFADVNLTASGSGVQCTQTKTQVTYGNPARITLHGVICYAQLHFGNFTTPASVPIAYLTYATCPASVEDCKKPHLHNPKAMHGYGVFGAGLTGIQYRNDMVPNPILTLAGHRGEVFSVRLTPQAGELVLGSNDPQDGASRFPLIPGTLRGEKWQLGETCLFVNEKAINKCLTVSFDTGNGVPWIHDVEGDSIPVKRGVVEDGIRIGFAPMGSSSPAAEVTAGDSFSNTIKVSSIAGKAPITNTSIQAFINHIVTYDNKNGTITFRPFFTPSPAP